MADLLTTQTLAKWTQNDPDEVAADPFAVDLIDKVSQLICWIGGHDGATLDLAGETIPAWTLEAGPDQAPIDIQMVALQVIKRSYENPTQVTQEGNVGPIGGDGHLDVYALFAEFTDEERARIAKYNPWGDPEASDDGATVFVLQTTRGDDDTLPTGSTLYVGDNQQINLESSADPREWKIPMFTPGDPGDDLNYDED